MASPKYTYVNRGTFLARLTVTDSLGATASKTVTISVRRQPRLTNTRSTIPGTLSFNIEGETNVTYRIQASYDGINWTHWMTLPNPELPAQITLSTSDKPVLLLRAVME